METNTVFSRFETKLALSRQKRFIAFALLFFGYMALQFFVSPTLRGSDQYWYVGDVERVVLQDGLFKTNSIFPNSMPENLSDLPRPWVQNKPLSYLVLPLVYLTQDGHIAWMLFNILCLFSAAFLIARVLKISNGKLLYFIAAFVLFPFNFYLATQALPEVFIMFLIAAIHYLLLVSPLNFKKIALLGMITAILICQRPNYILLIFFIPVLFYFFHRSRVVILSVSFLSIAVAFSFIATLFGEHLITVPSIIDTIINNDHATTNMGNFFDNYDHSSITISELIPIFFHKLIGALQMQFAITGMSAFMFYLVNMMLLSIPVLYFQKKMRNQQHLLCLIFIVIHFMTVILFYNQYRYAASIIPSLFILCFSLIQNDSWRWFRGTPFRMGFIGCCMAVSVAIGWQVRKQALADKVMIEELRQIVQERKFPSLMCSWNNGAGLGVGYAISPKSIYYFPYDISLEKWFETAEKLHTKSGIINPKSTLYKKLKPFVVFEKELEHTGMTYFEVNSDNKY